MVVHSPWGQDPSGLCFCDDCSAEELPPDYYPDEDYPSFDPERPTHAYETDITMYWPWVRHCWREPRLEPEDDDVREAIWADTEEWRYMDWRMKQYYRWLIRSTP